MSPNIVSTKSTEQKMANIFFILSHNISMYFPPSLALPIRMMPYEFIALCSTSLKSITFIKTQNNNNINNTFIIVLY